MLDAQQGDTPILKLFRRHQHLIELSNANENDATDQEQDRLYWDEVFSIESAMQCMPCTCAADFAAKAIADTAKGEVFSDWETSPFWQEARALTGISDPSPNKSSETVSTKANESGMSEEKLDKMQETAMRAHYLSKGLTILLCDETKDGRTAADMLLDQLEDLTGQLNRGLDVVNRK